MSAAVVARVDGATRHTRAGVKVSRPAQALTKATMIDIGAQSARTITDQAIRGRRANQGWGMTYTPRRTPMVTPTAETASQKTRCETVDIPPAPKLPDAARIAPTPTVTAIIRSQARATSLGGGRPSALGGAAGVRRSVKASKLRSRDRPPSRTSTHRRETVARSPPPSDHGGLLPQGEKGQRW